MENTRGQYLFTHLSGEDIYLFRLRNTKGTEVCITNYGAIITSFTVLESDGASNNIVLGFDDVKEYLADNYLSSYPYFGAVIGRYANRIKNAEFYLGDKKYKLAKNKAPDHLHGGESGFDKKVWKLKSYSDKKLSLCYRSVDGEEGYPGNLDTEILFELTEENELIYEFFGHTDRATAINLTHHSYFNLNNGNGTIGSHEVALHAGKILAQDNNFVATGHTTPVAGTRYDFTQAKRIERDWLPADGYDQSYVLTREGIDHVAAEAYSEASGLRLKIFTSEPVVHFYTGKWIPQMVSGSGKTYGPFSGLCFETQKHPNAVNLPNAPNTILQPGETYHTKTIYRVSS
ncbi:MAG: galactose mutarotase [Chitinophagaceae bacterium]|nr:MAG: galactose mutarotase [Chitinophagaceae bacterium]